MISDNAAPRPRQRKPPLGVEAVRRAPPQSRGLVMGMYTAFLDVALGFGTPASGFIAGRSGLSTVFLASAMAVLGAAAFAALLLATPARHEPSTAIRHPTRKECCHDQ